jgi:DNA-binding LacI/PurR family transcriptional regulator
MVSRMAEPVRPTMRFIARKASVSNATVSLALRNHPSIPPLTRARIKKVAADLGYRPNALVTALMRQVRNNRPITPQETIGFLTADPSPEDWKRDFGFMSFFEGAHDRAESLGFKLEHFWLGPFGRNGRAISKVLEARGIRGAVIGPLPVHQEVVQMAWPRLAISAIGFSFEQRQFHRACHHQVNGMMLLYNKLHGLGYRRIGFAIMSLDLVRVRHYYLSGFLTSQNLNRDCLRLPPLVLRDDSELPGLLSWARRYKPDVIVSIGWKIYRWLIGSTIRIPKDIGFAQLSLDGTYANIAGIDQRSPLLGATAFDLVIEQLFRNESGVPESPKMVLLDGEWTPGRSAPGI